MFNFLLDLLFPPCCLQCKRIGSYLCSQCQYEQRYYTQPIPIEIENASLDQLFACCTYATGARKLITCFKYKSAYSLTQTLVQLMVGHIPFPDDIDLFTAIPLHPTRQNMRGFNQAELLAKQLAKWLQIPYQPTLIRTIATSPQAQLDRQERLVHLIDAFAIINPEQIVGKTIALIDDVTTTGTTLNEAAKVLKAHGAFKVYGVVFAHGK